MSALSWAVVSAPIGPLTVGATEVGLCLVAFGAHPERAVAVAERLDLEPVEEPSPAVRQLAEYFAGERRVFDLTLDWRLTHGTQRTVLQTLFRGVPFGGTTTYAELAAASGAYEGHGYTAARGVGSIMGSNPIPVVVPCHRVTAADGLGGFGGGRATKEWLLAHEGVLTPTLF
ncbi:methylated-DNA--[protein]-cysteine S-methyltransferase [Pseudonocardia pini]|uniref:methylated-DNA--[protein]-cysteine S-methyltransferase n=1 Tax=Pseudonocardia pini TaxID=2758030 RepID=UPI0015F022C8|nr:methylated-DNA--[protein]-cysteine S-methyltransferase [Pseudonocardia pini]